MNMRALMLASVLGFAGPAGAADVWNPYARPASAFEQRLQAAAFGEPGADRALHDWLEAHPELAARQRILAYGQLCSDYSVLSWHALRALACAEKEKLKRASGDSDGGDDDGSMSATLAAQPPIRAIGSAVVPLTWNAFGSQSIDAAVNGVTASWFFDTGAGITVLTASLAERMGVRRVGDNVRVGTTTADVHGGVGMIDRMQIGSATVENVPVLILPDAQLKIGNVHQIDGILGFPVMVAFGRVAWVDGGQKVALGETAPKAKATAQRIYWDPEGLGVAVSTSSGIMGAFVDTGANATDWRTAGVALLDPAVVAAAGERISHVGGAGGVVEIKQRELKDVAFKLGGVPVRLERVSLADSEEANAAKIGMDAVSQFGTFILDFEQMRIDGRLKTPAQRKATRRTVLTQKDVQLAPEEQKPD